MRSLFSTALSFPLAQHLRVLPLPDPLRSPSCRFNLAAGFAEKARDAGSLGLAAVFVWLRYCQTRQLNWNVNYNVKPRCATPSPREDSWKTSKTLIVCPSSIEKLF